MSSPGEPDRTFESIRPAPRPVRAAPVSGPPPPPPAPAQPPEPPAPIQAGPKPDRARMDPLSLDLSTTKTLQSANRKLQKGRSRSRQGRRNDRWLLKGVLLLIGIFLAAGTFLLVRSLLKPGHGTRQSLIEDGLAAPLATPDTPSAGRALKLVQDLLAAPDANAKAAFVLDRERVLPLMTAAYATGRFPESQLSFGVPLTLEKGLTLVPAQVTGTPGLLLHLLVKETEGSPLLDWETYEQDLGQRFLNFAAKPGRPGGDFRLVLERAHDFDSGPAKTPAVRVAPIGSSALAAAVTVSPEAQAAITSGLPWNQRRRALVRLEWNSTTQPPRIVLRELVRWDFLP